MAFEQRGSMPRMVGGAQRTAPRTAPAMRTAPGDRKLHPSPAPCSPRRACLAGSRPWPSLLPLDEWLDAAASCRMPWTASRRGE